MVHYDKYAEEELQHGLGVGGGRGRPKGSRNGYINPNAAYMKNYKVVGEKAEGEEDPDQPVSPDKTIRNERLGNYSYGSRQSAQATPRTQNVQQTTQKTVAASKPQNSVQAGKTLMEKYLTEDTQNEQYLSEEYLNELAFNSQKNPGQTETNRDMAVEVSPAYTVGNGRNVYINGVEGRVNSKSQAKEEPYLSDEYKKQLEFNSKKTNYFGFEDDGKAHAYTVDPETHETIRDDNPRFAEIMKNAGEKVSNAGKAVADTAKNVGSAVGSAAKTAGEAVGNAAKNVGSTVGKTAQALAEEADKAWNGQDVLKPSTDIGMEVRPDYQVGQGRNADYYYLEGKSASEHQKGIRENIEDSLVDAGDQAKAWWEDLLDWGESAWNDTKNWATSAIDTGSRAFNDAKTWIGDRFNDAGSWAQTAYKDVSNWMGDRGAELDRWWNGYDEKKVYGKPENRAERQESHVNGFRENAANWIDQAGKDVGNWAQQNIANPVSNAYRDATNWLDQAGKDVSNWAQQNVANPVNDAYKNASQWVTDRADDVANAANRLWNGYDTEKTYGSPEDRERRQESHVNGLHENVEQAAGEAVDTVRNAIGEASDNVVRTVRDAAGNVHQAVVNAAGDIVGWVGERAEDVDKWWNGYETEKTYGSPADRERRQESRVNGFRENAVNAVNNAAEQIRQAVGDAGTAIRDLPENAGNWVQQNVTNPVTGAIETYLVNPVTGAYQKVSDAVQSAANTAVGMARNAGMAVQPAVNWMDRNVVQPVAGFVSSRANAAQMNGDNLSTKALNSGYSMPAVNYITQMAVNGDISTGERERLMTAMDLAANKDQGQRAAYYLGQLSRGAIDFNEAMSKIEDLSKQNRGQNNR